MEDYDYSFHNIGIRCIDRFIQVENKKALLEYLEQPGNRAMMLAKEMKNRYKKERGTDINITQTSLAIEVVGHLYAGELSKLSALVPGPKELKAELKKFTKEIQKHVDIIDCGEKEVDSNRVIWDSLEKYAKIVFMLTGQGS